MKYAYTGEVSMAENRVPAFMEAAKSLEMIGLMDKNEIMEKFKKKKNKKRSFPKQNSDDESEKTLEITASDTTLCNHDQPKRMRLNTLVKNNSAPVAKLPINSETSASSSATFGANSRKRRTSEQDSDQRLEEVTQALKRTRSGDNPSYFYISQSSSPSIPSENSDNESGDEFFTDYDSDVS